MKLKIFITVLIFTLILLPPLLLRRAPEERLTAESDQAERLVIITPHNDNFKSEMAIAFRRHYKKVTGKDITLDYRAPGGTSDIMRFIADRYKLEFRNLCERKKIPWNNETAAAFANPNVDSDPKASSLAKKARKAFLESDIGIGIDLMCGGGVFDMSRNARNGFAVDAGIKEKYPELLDPAIIPASFGGETIYDPKGRYYGVCLSTFGICYNKDRINELKDKTIPRRWSDMAQPRFYNKIVVADPSKSGSANKCFEIIIQQVMAEKNDPAQGWIDGLNLIKRIIANAAFVTDSAGKVARDVSAGSAAVGMAIDTYGLTEGEWNDLQFDGDQRFFYLAPEGGTAVSPDPVQLLRGAPNKHAAVEFIRFLLSKEGQYILTFKAGTPGGPVKTALRRPSVRRDLYGKEYLQYRSDPDYNPYASGASFKYHAEWTGRYYSLLRILIRVLMLDCQDELKDAWRTIVENGGPEANPEAMKHFNYLPFTYAEASAASKALSGSQDGVIGVVRLKQKWRSTMRFEYMKAAELAREK